MGSAVAVAAVAVGTGEPPSSESGFVLLVLKNKCRDRLRKYPLSLCTERGWAQRWSKRFAIGCVSELVPMTRRNRDARPRNLKQIFLTNQCKVTHPAGLEAQPSADWVEAETTTASATVDWRARFPSRHPAVNRSQISIHSPQSDALPTTWWGFVVSAKLTNYSI